jgi:rhodanese-related sulfurtransferase
MKVSMPYPRKLKGIVLKSILIIILGSVVGLSYNSLSSKGITLKGSWSSQITSDSVIVPYTYQKDDAPAVSLDYAQMKFQSSKVIFLDARLPADFKAGHIKGAINFPYEEFEQYSTQVISKLPTNEEIIAYCDGGECESSLLLSRELRDLGYRNVKVFFGGWSEWKKAGLAVETGPMDPN